MKKVVFVFYFILAFSSKNLYAQNSLPQITVKNLNGKIIISWLNDYKKKVSDILVQRSYDSLKNYTTIGTVLIPQNLENGYPDLNPPYNKMYYRVTIVFEGGAYIVGNPSRPVKEKIITEIKEPALITQVKDSIKKDPLLTNRLKDSIKKDTAFINIIKDKIPISTVSKRIYLAKNNNIAIDIPDASTKKYSIKFFDETGKLIVDLKKITEDYLFIEKVNFIHSGLFKFEIYCEDKLIEKNTILITKDPKVLNR